jgi:transposase
MGVIVGMTSLVARNLHRPEAADPRITALLARKPVRVATVALANHAARAIWAIMVRGEVYRAPAPVAYRPDQWPQGGASEVARTM